MINKDGKKSTTRTSSTCDTPATRLGANDAPYCDEHGDGPKHTAAAKKRDAKALAAWEKKRAARAAAEAKAGEVVIADARRGALGASFSSVSFESSEGIGGVYIL